MPTTNIRGRQILDGDIARVDLNTSTSSSAVIRKLLPASDASITLTSTGADVGTGDVTLVTAKATASQLGVVRVGSGLSIDSNGILSATGGGSGTINGSGSAGYIPKFTDVATIANSLILDNGSGVSLFAHPSFVYRFNIQGFSGNFISFWSPTINGNFNNGIISHNGTGFGGQTPMGYNATIHVFNGEVTGGGTMQVAGDVNISGTFKVNGTPIGTGGGGVSGSGTTNYIPLWSGSTSLSNSRISQNSTQMIITSSDGASAITLTQGSGFGESWIDFGGNIRALRTLNIGVGTSPTSVTTGYNLFINGGTNTGNLVGFTPITCVTGNNMNAFARMGSSGTWAYMGVGGGIGELNFGATTTESTFNATLVLGANRFGTGYYNTLYVKWNTIGLPYIPTSSSGLSSGDIYRDASGYLRIV